MAKRLGGDQNWSCGVVLVAVFGFWYRQQVWRMPGGANFWSGQYALNKLIQNECFHPWFGNHRKRVGEKPDRRRSHGAVLEPNPKGFPQLPWLDPRGRRRDGCYLHHRA